MLAFRKLLQENGIEQSMSRIGNSLDNRPIEYWFSIIKKELLKALSLNNISCEQIYNEIKISFIVTTVKEFSSL